MLEKNNNSGIPMGRREIAVPEAIQKIINQFNRNAIKLDEIKESEMGIQNMVMSIIQHYDKSLFDEQKAKEEMNAYIVKLENLLSKANLPVDLQKVRDEIVPIPIAKSNETVMASASVEVKDPKENP